jgi:argonaute-like protein implicated in RNA metabolism and viral defense
MSKITYLLGAGASCNALPLVNNFKDRLDSFHTRLVDNLRPHIQPSSEKEARELFPFGGKKGKDLQESILWLKDIADKHASIDTYAKKLFIRNDNEALIELKKLKATLSCYFLLEQSLEMTDKRYDNFLASILTRKELGIPKLPKDVNIITWNYDTQLEKSYQGFCTIPETVYENFTLSKNIIRLNGTCALPHKLETRFLGHCDFNIPFLEEVIKLFKNYTTIEREVVGYQPDISFAWEQDDIPDKVKK